MRGGTDKPMPDHFRQNLSFAIYERCGPAYRDKILADALKVDRSTVNRLRNSATPPAGERLECLSRYFDVAPATWNLPSEDFVAEYHRRTRAHATPTSSGSVCVSSSTISTHRYLWPRCFDTHKGQYIAYWKASDLDGYYVASLLEITNLTNEGITFELLNPYIREDIDHDDVRGWRYQGRLYPVSDYLYFFGEQTNSTYELFSMIMTSSPVAPPDILRGCLSGIHVRDGKKQIAVNIAVVLLYVKKHVDHWQNEIGGRLGKLPAGRVPERIRKIIDPLPGVVTLGA